MKRSTFLRLMLGAGALGAATRDVHAEIPKMPAPVNPPPPARDRSVQLEIEHAIDKGLLALQGKQSSYGYWSTPETPGLTALVLTAFMEEPTGGLKAQPPDFVKKGYDYILKSQQPDGGIYLKGLANYSTSVCMLALAAADSVANADVLRRARTFLIGLQGHFPESSDDAVYDGGIGYDAQDKPIQNANSPSAAPAAANASAPKPAAAPAAHLHYDLSNTAFAIEALHKTQQLAADQKIEGAKDLDWKAAAGFIERCQSLPGVNKQSWVKDDPKNNGGFVYEPTNKKGTPCYGSMSYAGLMSYIYADLRKDDPRVAAAYGWLKSNYMLDQNPGMGGDGLFYYYQMMSKALAAYGDVHLETGGKKVDWANELALKLINLQGSDGTWVNSSGRWWEKDPSLVTAYAVLTLETLHAHV